MKNVIPVPFVFDTEPIERMVQDEAERLVRENIERIVETNVNKVLPYGYGYDAEKIENRWKEYLNEAMYKWFKGQSELIIKLAALTMAMKVSRNKQWKDALKEAQAVMDMPATVSFSLDDGLDESFAPNRAHDTDAGADLKTVNEVTVEPHGTAVVSTGVHVEIPHGYCGLLVSKSGLNVKFALTTTGLIDEGYTGEILVKVYNSGVEPYHFNKGDKVTQLVLLPVLYAEYVLVDEIGGGERGDNGYGSTGK